MMRSFASERCLERLGVHGGKFDEAMIRAMVRALWTGLAPRKGGLEGRDGRDSAGQPTGH